MLENQNFYRIYFCLYDTGEEREKDCRTIKTVK